MPRSGRAAGPRSNPSRLIDLGRGSGLTPATPCPKMSGYAKGCRTSVTNPSRVVPPMRVFITGGSGMIGRRLARRLKERGDQPVVLSRDSDNARRKPAMRGIVVVAGDPTREGPWQEEVDGSDAVVNLAGHNVFGGRWDA